MIDFGVQICQEEFDYSGLVRATKEIEEMGFDSVWLYDHFYPMIDARNVSVLECFTTLSSIATQTKNIRIGSLVACNSYRSPSLLAKIGASLDVISDGRLEFGIGAGWHEMEYEAYGFPFPEASVRLRQLEEAVQVIRKLWIERAPNFQGRFYSLKNAICEPKPLQKPHPPIWIGGTGEKRTLKIVAKYADYCNFVCSPQQYQHKLEVLEKYCLEVGRSFQSIRKSWHGFLVLVEDSNSIREKIGSIKSKNPIERVREMTLQKFVDDHIVGTKQECIDKIQELVDAGVTYIVPHVYDFPTLQVTKILSQEIIPSFK